MSIRDTSKIVQIFFAQVRFVDRCLRRTAKDRCRQLASSQQLSYCTYVLQVRSSNRHAENFKVTFRVCWVCFVGRRATESLGIMGHLIFFTSKWKQSSQQLARCSSKILVYQLVLVAQYCSTRSQGPCRTCRHSYCIKRQLFFTPRKKTRARHKSNPLRTIAPVKHFEVTKEKQIQFPTVRRPDIFD